MNSGNLIISHFQISGSGIWDFLYHSIFITYREDLEKREVFGVVAHERLTEPRVTMEWQLAKPRSFSNLPAFLDLHGKFFGYRKL